MHSNEEVGRSISIIRSFAQSDGLDISHLYDLDEMCRFARGRAAARPGRAGEVERALDVLEAWMAEMRALHCRKGAPDE